jgi:hypothetical protein
MSALIRKNLRALTASAISGAAPQTVNGNALAIMNPDGSSALAVAPGTLSALVTLAITTSSLAVSAKWQVSSNGSTWVDAANAPQNPAAVALATGTGSIVTTTKSVPAPDSVYGFLYARCVLTTSGASGGGAGVDEASISYNCRVVNAAL